MSESKTPRTDAEALDPDASFGGNSVFFGKVDAEFARQLELELSSAFRRGQEEMRERAGDMVNDARENTHDLRSLRDHVRALPILDSVEEKK